VISELSPDAGVWLDGELIKAKDARLPLWAHHYGFGVFEGLRAYATARGTGIFRLRDHTARLYRSARILGIPLEARWAPATLEEAQIAVVRQNGLANAYVRPFAFFDGVRGLAPTTGGLELRVAVLALPWSDAGAHGSTSRDCGLAVRTASLTRHHPSALLLRAKANAHYMTSILALSEAKAAGADEALLLDHEGFVAEGTGANVFIVRGGELVSPPSTSALDGITRATVMTLAAEAGLRVTEARFARDDVYVADEAFFTGTAVEIMPIRMLDGRVLGSGRPGPITRQITDLYMKAVRGDTDREDRRWMTWI
jgi:branched-chain amino acid aminotransferase